MLFNTSRPKTLWLTLVLTAFAVCCQAHVWHVTPNGSDIAGGLSWADALASPQAALDRAAPGDQIWLSQGIYFPEANSLRPLPVGGFLLRDGVSLYGGFEGTENHPDERERHDRNGNGMVELWEFTHETILSLPDNVQGTVLSTGTTPFSFPTCIDGLTVTGGHNSGAAMVDSPGLGGGGFLDGALVVQDCEFIGNCAQQGGALYAVDGVHIDSCLFTDNSARRSGGALWLEGESSQATNCVFLHNGTASDAISGGGAVWLTNQAELSFSTFSKNAAAGPGSALHAENESLLRNCVIWEGLGHGQESEITASCQVIACAVMDGGTPYLADQQNYGISAENAGGHGINKNDNTPYSHFPCFTTPENDNYAPGDGSFLINRGIHYDDAPATDACGNPRIRHGLPDIGAYESDALGNLVISAELGSELYYGLTAELIVALDDEVIWEATSADSRIVSLNQDVVYGEHVGQTELLITYTPEDDNWSDGEFRLPVTVLPRPLAVDAGNVEWHSSRQPRPELTWRISAGQLVPGDSLAGELACLQTAFPSELPSSFPITQGTLGVAPQTNAECYQLAFEEGVLQCLENRADICLEDCQTIYQGVPIVLEATTLPDGLGLEYRYQNALTGETLSQPPIMPGEYLVTATVVDDEFSGAATATLTITKAQLLCQADDIYRAYRKPNPELTCTFTGFVNGETVEVLDNPPVLATTATLESPIIPEGYPISISIGEDDCYEITAVPGTLYVTLKQPNINEVAATVMTYGEPLELVWLMAYSTDPDTDEYVPGEFIWADAECVLDAGLWICPWTFVPDDLDTYGCVKGKSEVTIMRRPIRVEASDRRKPYGDPEVRLPLTVTLGSLARGDRFQGDMERIAGEEPGTYPIKQGTLTIVRGERDVLHNYELIFVEGTYTIELRQVTIAADSLEKLGGQPDPVFTWQIVVGSLLDEADLTGTLAREPGETAGEYRITQGTLMLPETYQLTFIEGVLTIRQTLLEIAADDQGNPQFTVDPITYGEPLDGETQIHGTVISTATGEEVPGIFTWDHDGEYPETGEQEQGWAFTPEDQDQFIPLTGEVTITVLPAMLTVTAHDATRAYGTPNPSFGYEITGFVLGEDAGVLEHEPVLSCAATTSSKPGDYAITASGGVAANYAFQYVDGTLTVTRGSVHGDGTQVVAVGTLTYGQALGELPLEGMFTDEAGQPIPGALAWNEPETYPTCAATEAGWTFTPQDAECYEGAAGTAVIVVNPALLTVTANDATRTYGTPNPSSFGYEITGFVLAEYADVLEQEPVLSCAATTSSNPGDYAITASGGVAANYAFQYVDGTLSITSRMVAIQADDLSKRYGTADPTLTYHVIGDDLLPGDTFSGSLSRESGESVGSYNILRGTLTISDNYSLAFYPGVFTIQPAELEIAKDDSGKERLTIDDITYGEQLNGEEQIHGTVISTATAEEVPGTFHWEQDGETPPAGEHELVWVFTPDDEEKYTPIQGTAVMTVVPALLNVRALDAQREYAQENPPFELEFTGFVLGEDLSFLRSIPVAETAADRYSYPGDYPIIVSGGVADNYRFDYQEGILTITPTQNYLVKGNNNWAYLKYGQKFSEADVYPDFHDAANQVVEGSVTWPEPDRYPDCATTESDILFTPTDQLRYKPVATSIHLRVERASLGLACNGFTREYNQENPELTYIFFDFILDDTEETAVTARPVMHTDAELTSLPGYYGVWATDYYAPNYDIGRSDAIAIITKAHLEVGPGGIRATDLIYGQKLEESALSGIVVQHAKTPQTIVTGTFSWATPEIVLPCGTSRQRWVFTPDNVTCYEILEGDSLVTVFPAPLTVSLSSARRLYGEENPSFTYEISGFVGTDTTSILVDEPLVECAATPSSAVGEYAIRCEEVEDGNYQLICEEGHLTIMPRTLAISANSVSKRCLEADPELTYVMAGDGLVNGDILTGHLERDPGEEAGEYTIRQGTLAAPQNYDTHFTAGTLTIERLRPQLIEAHGSEFIYGQRICDSDYGATFANPLTGDLIPGTLTIEAPEFRPWAGTAKHRVYFHPADPDKFTDADAVVRFTVRPRPLHVQVTPPVILHGQDLTSIDYVIDAGDLLPGDAIEPFFPLLQEGTRTLSAGSYPLIATPMSADRNVAHSYEVILDNAVLTVNPAPWEVWADNQQIGVGDDYPQLTYTVADGEFENADELRQTLAGSLSVQEGTSMGEYLIEQGTLCTDSNHSLQFHPGILTIGQRLLTPVYPEITLLPGDDIPDLQVTANPDELLSPADQVDSPLVICEGTTEEAQLLKLRLATAETGNPNYRWDTSVTGVVPIGHPQVLVDPVKYSQSHPHEVVPALVGDHEIPAAAFDFRRDETFFGDLASAQKALRPGGILWMAPGEVVLASGKGIITNSLEIRGNIVNSSHDFCRLTGELSIASDVHQLRLVGIEILNPALNGIALNLTAASEDLTLWVDSCVFAADRAMLLKDFSTTEIKRTDFIYRDIGMHLLPGSPGNGPISLDDVSFTHETTSGLESYWHIYCENARMECSADSMHGCRFDGLTADATNLASIKEHIYASENGGWPATTVILP